TTERERSPPAARSRASNGGMRSAKRRGKDGSMMHDLRFMRHVRLPAFSLLFVTSAALAQAPTPEPVTDQETELGNAMYDQLRAKAEIIQSSPLYDNLKPIADAISRVSQSRYPHPFKFYLVHEAQPNAFATPGGNVYVVDSLLHFVKNTEQLAGTLCHEVSH